jgi:hypothetical protein
MCDLAQQLGEEICETVKSVISYNKGQQLSNIIAQLLYELSGGYPLLHL